MLCGCEYKQSIPTSVAAAMVDELEKEEGLRLIPVLCLLFACLLTRWHNLGVRFFLRRLK